jgi:neutral ceramidase
MYKYDVDKNMTLIRLQDKTGKDIGMINWFAVHGTSMNNTNQFISGDNKGYASYIFEKLMNGNSSLPGMGPYVAAFAQR